MVLVTIDIDKVNKLANLMIFLSLAQLNMFKKRIKAFLYDTPCFINYSEIYRLISKNSSAPYHSDRKQNAPILTNTPTRSLARKLNSQLKHSNNFELEFDISNSIEMAELIKNRIFHEKAS